jgi:hypothetical protein
MENHLAHFPSTDNQSSVIEKRRTGFPNSGKSLPNRFGNLQIQSCCCPHGNILRRHLRPAAVKLGFNPKKATWRSLRTSCATWMIEAGANPKDVQG